MARVEKFEDLEVWQLARSLCIYVEDLFQTTGLDKKLISEEQYKALIEMCELEINKIGAFMYYLRNSDIKGQKFKKD
ncbi:MAG: hypothetical protein K8F54_11160 [Altibacter sp.]|uniref:hypothetical protein n=1 Tax=Altibacter sp. TaxID=2024823 RepID=UPI001D222C03|nr:hypothetical protein [Altibacter sp.]MBZ0328156.1 hypothetical protein [Altibacter sp.]